ncbi:50S ribosomal protein L31e [archaeon]|jgi:large subunit ribosomal protein L31e|nr:50S ribosomal protein L31e [archaeon]MBT3577456.1 50S ribosomal protein L31e [archaeon]MBT6820301.1 50S ribosomal protein L31e [archaeon]MBT6955998.1 50S ribosomal protein L31e [archaeon]MBT7025115.1 50S ribosomal protein L31e [archaeon]
MAEETKPKVEEKKEEAKAETKKLDDIKGSPENKEAIAKAEGKTVETKTESKPAVKKADDNELKIGKKKAEPKKAELEREYVIPIKKYILTVPRYKRAKKAVKVVKQFLAKHMRVEDRDLNLVKIDINLNNELWFRGIKKPANKIKVKAVKRDGIVYAELAEVPEVVKFKIAREEKRKAAASKNKKKAPKKAKEEAETDKDKDGVADKIEEAEDKKSVAEKAAKTEKNVAKEMKHTAQGKHMKKTMPVRKALKK